MTTFDALPNELLYSVLFFAQPSLQNDPYYLVNKRWYNISAHLRFKNLLEFLAPLDLPLAEYVEKNRTLVEAIIVRLNKMTHASEVRDFLVKPNPVQSLQQYIQNINNEITASNLVEQAKPELDKLLTNFTPLLIAMIFLRDYRKADGKSRCRITLMQCYVALEETCRLGLHFLITEYQNRGLSAEEEKLLRDEAHQRYQLGLEYLRVANYSEAESLLLRSFTAFHGLNDQKYIANTACYLGQSRYAQRKLEAAISSYEIALSQGNNQYLGEGVLLIAIQQLSDAYYDCHLYKKLINFLTCINDSKDNLPQKLFALDEVSQRRLLLGKCYYETKEYLLAEFCLANAFNEFGLMKDELPQGECQLYRGKCACEQGEYAKALLFLDQAYELYKTQWYALARVCLAFADFYRAQKNYLMEKQYLCQAYERYQRLQGTSRCAPYYTTTLRLGICLHTQGLQEEALIYLQEAERYYLEQGDQAILEQIASLKPTSNKRKFSAVDLENELSENSNIASTKTNRL